MKAFLMFYVLNLFKFLLIKSELLTYIKLWCPKISEIQPHPNPPHNGEMSLD
jgi:hypothetical protein